MNNELIKKGIDAVTDIHYSGEEEGKFVSERHQYDVLSDNWLSKSVRPISLLILLGLLVYCTFASANGVVIDPEILDILKIWGASFLSFYTGFRSWEKVRKIDRTNAKQDRKDARLKARIERRRVRKMIDDKLK